MDTFRGHLQLSALGDLDSLLGLVAAGSLGVLDLGDNIHALEDLAEDDVTAIEPPDGCLLASASVYPSVGRFLLRDTYEVMTVVMKNCEPLVSLPALAMDSMPGLVCLSLKFSSGNFSP